jgi:hypothetical protein
LAAIVINKDPKPQDLLVVDLTMLHHLRMNYRVWVWQQMRGSVVLHSAGTNLSALLLLFLPAGKDETKH